MSDQPEMKYVIEGTIQSVFEDLGPSVQVSLLLKNGGTWTTDAEAYPVRTDELRKMIGRRIRLTCQMEFTDQPAEESMNQLNLIDEAMNTAKLMAGASWPSADMTRWALKHLARLMADRAAAMYEDRKGPMVLRDELLASCGLQFGPESASMRK